MIQVIRWSLLVWQHPSMADTKRSTCQRLPALRRPQGTYFQVFQGSFDLCKWLTMNGNFGKLELNWLKVLNWCQLYHDKIVHVTYIWVKQSTSDLWLCHNCYMSHLKSATTSTVFVPPIVNQKFWKYWRCKRRKLVFINRVKIRDFCYCWKILSVFKGSSLFICRLQNTRLLKLCLFVEAYSDPKTNESHQ